MKVNLMYPDRPFVPDLDLPSHVGDLEADLGLDLMLDAMSRSDSYMRHVARAAIHQPLSETADIVYRQAVLADVVHHREVINRMYSVASEAAGVERLTTAGWHSTKPSSRLNRARALLVEFLKLLRRLRTDVDEYSTMFESSGLRQFCARMQHDLSEEYLREVDGCLARLEFRFGVDESAHLGMANEGTAYAARTPPRGRPASWKRLVPAWSRDTVSVADRDYAGMESLDAIKESGFAVTAEVLTRSSEDVKEYFAALRRELGFYLACVNLHEVLVKADLPVCMPTALETGHCGATARQLHDPMLVIRGEHHPVGNNLCAKGASLVVITGANQGGKSTFLRAMGIGQIMMQAGMFVAADEFSAGLVSAVRTHYKREEDSSMISGKFDEELARLSSLVESLHTHDLVLCNESFSSTNEREATLVGADIMLGMLDCGVQVRLVTHLYEFAERLRTEVADATFLREARLDDGTRSHQIIPGEPLTTSYGDDLYEQVFNEPLGIFLIPTSHESSLGVAGDGARRDNV